MFVETKDDSQLAGARGDLEEGGWTRSSPLRRCSLMWVAEATPSYLERTQCGCPNWAILRPAATSTRCVPRTSVLTEVTISPTDTSVACHFLGKPMEGGGAMVLGDNRD